MDGKRLVNMAIEFTDKAEENYISKDVALSPELEGVRMYEAPIFGFASSGDAIFESYKKPESIGMHFIKPEEWLAGSKTVISFFLPFTKEVIVSNSKDFAEPSYLWLHGRIEGQTFLNKLTQYLLDELEKSGFKSMSPGLDARFKSTTDSPMDGLPAFSSNWSERHAAYAAGLGTFGLSRGIITEKGMAGRLSSIVTTGEFPVTERKYANLYDYCTNCGACVRNCPVKAITLEKGKEHPLCSELIEASKLKHKPRYGCGKCQVKTPCTFGIPK